MCEFMRICVACMHAVTCCRLTSQYACNAQICVYIAVHCTARQRKQQGTFFSLLILAPCMDKTVMSTSKKFKTFEKNFIM